MALLAGCSQSAPVVAPIHPAEAPTLSATPTARPTARPTPDPRLDSVDVSVPGLLDTLNPLLTRTPAGRALAALIFSGLVTARADGTFGTGLATSWSSADGHHWIFHLDPDRRWQDGTAVTSADVAYSVGLVQSAGSPVDPAWRSAWQGIQVATPDAETVTVTVPLALGAAVLDLATMPILPEHILEQTAAASLAMLPFSSRPVGSGDYRLVTANSFAATLEATGNAHLAPRRLTIHFVPTRGTGGASGDAREQNPAVQRTVPTSGPDIAIPRQTDHSAAPDTNLASSSKGKADGVVRWLPGNATAPAVRVPISRPVFLFLNTRRGPTADVQVRKALGLAIDRRKIVEGPLDGAAVPLRLPMAPEFWAAADAAKVPDTDAARAAATLQADGWVEDGRGRRTRDGRALTLTLIVDDDPVRLAVAEQVASMWQAAGVQTDVEQVGLAGLVRDFALPGHFDAILLGMQDQGVLPSLDDLWRTGGTLDISGWSDPLTDAALDATHAVGADTRLTGYQRFAQRFADQLPAIPLYLPVASYAVDGLRLPAAIVDSPDDILRGAANWQATPSR